MSLDQLRMYRVGQVEELVVKRKSRVVPAWTSVQEPTTAKAQLYEQLLLRPDAQLSRRHSDRLSCRVRGGDLDGNFAHHSRICWVGDVDDQYAWVDVGASPIGIGRRQDRDYRSAAVEISARVRPVRPIPDIDIVVEHRDRSILATAEQRVVSNKLDIERGARTANTYSVSLD